MPNDLELIKQLEEEIEEELNEIDFEQIEKGRTGKWPAPSSCKIQTLKIKKS